MSSRRHLTLAACCSLVVGTLAGCGGSASSGGSAGSAEDTASVGLVAEPASLDFTSNDGVAIPQALLGNVYEGLVRIDQEGEIKPQLAERYERSEDGRSYTFHLRKGVKFSNGKEFTAADAVFSINRVTSDWKLKIAQQMDVVDKVTEVNDHVVKVELKKPSNGWLHAMTTRIGAMFSTTGVSDLANKPVGTGPFTLGSWKRGDTIVLDRSADYWGKKPGLKSVTLKYFKDVGAMNNAMLTDDIDIIGAVQAPETLTRFSDKSQYQVIEGASTSEVVLSMNNSREPFDDKEVRQAVRHAIDREALIKVARAGRGTEIGAMTPPTDPWYEDLTDRYPHDPAKARKMLRDAGADGSTVALRIPNLPYAVASAQVVKDQLDKAGLKVSIETLEFPARWLSEVFDKADYDMSIIAHPEPRDQWIFADSDYYFRYDNPAYSALLTEADTGKPEDEAASYREAMRVLAEDSPADWLYLMPNLMVANKGLSGLPVNQTGEGLELAGLRWTDK